MQKWYEEAATRLDIAFIKMYWRKESTETNAWGVSAAVVKTISNSNTSTDHNHSLSGDKK